MTLETLKRFVLSGWRGYALIFIASLVAVSAMLLIERAVGIDWDYHPDAVTYATDTARFVAVIIATPYLAFNVMHYGLMHLLGGSVVAMTALNMMLFAVTNVLVFHAQKEKIIKRKFWVWVLLSLFLLNPYRLHLATTILKDTVIIFFLALIWTQRFWWLWVIPLLQWRVAGLFYLSTVFPRRWFIAAGFVTLVLVAINHAYLVDFANSVNSANIRLRSFDTVPNFTDYGLMGTALRMLLWPLMSITGVFTLFSSSLLFVPLALGALVSLIFALVMTKRFNPWSWLAVYASMAAFAFFCTGFTTYIRYVYPVIGLLPLAVTFFDNKLQNQ